MSELSEITSPVLTKVERHQAFSVNRSPIKDPVLATSRQLATEPALYKELAPNPYSPHTQQRLRSQFTTLSLNDSTRALILAEPEGEYDREFHNLSREQRADKLYDQIDSSAEITTKLTNCVSDNMQTFLENASRRDLRKTYSSSFWNLRRQ